MAQKKYEVTCVVCGKVSEYCHICGKYDSNETWRYIYCSDSCRQIWHIADKYISKKITKEDASKALSLLELPKNKYNEKISNIITDVLKNDEVKEPVIESTNEQIEEVVDNVVEKEEVVPTQRTYKKKRNSSKNVNND